MATKTFAEQITFTRATTATFVGANGLIQTAAINAPRFEYDPITLAAKGLLVEESRTNLSTQSAAFNAVEWQQVAVTITPNVVTAPDGTMTADLVVPSAALENKRLTNVAVTDPKLVYTFSCFAKMQPGGYEIIELAYGATAVNAGNRGVASFNLNTGVVNTTSNTGAAVTHSAKIDRYPDGWYRCSVTFTATTGTETQINWQVMPRPPGVNSTVVAFEANGTSGAYIWGAQVELGTNATSYIPTTTAQVTRAADVANIAGANFSQNYNALEGTIYGEFEPLNQSVGSVALSINDGTLSNAIRMQSKQPGTLSSIRMMASNGVTDVYAVNSAGNNVLRYNGVDATENSIGNAALMTAVAYNGTDTFLKVGASGNIITSPDGLAHTNRSIEGATITNGIFGAGKFVVASVLGFRVSTDGTTWRRVNVPGQTQSQNEVAYNGTNTFVSVGATGTAYTSPDGETWTLRSTGVANNHNAVTFGAGLFVAAINATATNIRTSPDGITWTARTTAVAQNQNDVAYNGTNLFVSVGNNGTIQSSPDAVTWTSRTSGTTQILFGVHFAAGQWVAVGVAGTVITSPDGTTWTTRTSGTTNTLGEVTYVPFAGQSLWVAVGDGGTIITSPDAVTWTTQAGRTTSNYLGISHNGQTAVATGVSGIITSSTDGITWTARTGNNATLNGAAFGNGTFVVAGATANGSGVIATVDPVTVNGQPAFAYTRRVSGTTGNTNSVRFLNGAFYVGHSTGSVVGRSLDGITWTSLVVPGSATAWVDIAFGNSMYIVVGTNGRYAISTDGTAFATVASSGATTQQLNSIAFANNLFVAVGNAGAIITSTNGTDWVLRTSGTTQTLRTVNFSTRDQLWYAAGDNGVFLSSPDAITWTPVANRATAAIFSGGTLQANPTLLPNFTPAVPNKMAISYKANDVKVSVNGQTSQLDTSATLPSLTQLSIGMNGTSGQQFNGYIRNLQLFPKAVTSAEIEAMTL